MQSGGERAGEPSDHCRHRRDDMVLGSPGGKRLSYGVRLVCRVAGVALLRPGERSGVGADQSGVVEKETMGKSKRGFVSQQFGDERPRGGHVLRVLAGIAKQTKNTGVREATCRR